MTRATVAIPGARAVAWLPPRRVLSMAALAGLYYGAARFGYTLEFAGPVAAIVWFPAGVGIAFLTLGGLGLWPGLLVGDLLANDYTALPIGSALGQTAGNILEVAVAALLIRRSFRRESPLGSVAQVARLVLAIAVGTAVSATIGVLSLVLGHVTDIGGSPTIWRTWWLGDAVGALVVVPLALAWCRPPSGARWRQRSLEGGALVAVVLVLGEFALRSDQPLTYLLFPALIWAALRFGQQGATLTVGVVAVLSVWNTTHYAGPFYFHSITHSVLSTQLFIAVAAISTLCLAAVVSEREDLAEVVETSRARIVESADRERRRLERNLHDGAQQRLIALAARLSEAAGHESEASRRIAELLSHAEEEVKSATDELRELARGIHPAALTDLGLAHAVGGLAARATVPIVVLGLPPGRLDETVEATAYYLVAEALTNTQKYAGATRMWVSAVVSGDALQMDVADDGVGGAVEKAGAGLQGLRDRVEAIGGTFRLESPAGRGTSITAAIPVPPTAGP